MLKTWIQKGVFTLMMGVLLGLSLWEHLVFKHAFILVFMGFLLATTLLYIMYDFKKDLKDQALKAHVSLDLPVVILGCLATRLLVNELTLSSVLASSLVGIGGAILIKDKSAALFCGSFVGMSSPQLLSYYELILASGLAGLVFSYAKPAFMGIGGKLGTSALIGGFATVIMTHVSRYRFLELNFDTTLRLFSLNDLVLMVVLGAGAAWLTGFANKKKLNNIVLSSALIGLVGGLVLPMAFPNKGYYFALVVYTASFAGMTSPKLFKQSTTYLLAGGLSSLFFYASFPVLVGLGGKLGTIAFISSMSAMIVTRLFTQDPALNHNQQVEVTSKS